MNFRVTKVDSEQPRRMEVRKFERWEDATLWFGWLLAHSEGRCVTLSNEQTGKVIATTTMDYPSKHFL